MNRIHKAPNNDLLCLIQGTDTLLRRIDALLHGVVALLVDRMFRTVTLSVKLKLRSVRRSLKCVYAVGGVMVVAVLDVNDELDLTISMTS